MNRRHPLGRTGEGPSGAPAVGAGAVSAGAGRTGAGSAGPDSGVVVSAGGDSTVAEARRAVVRQSLSVGVATGAYGVSFGALAVAAGLDVWQAMALSLLMFTGGSQFAFVGIVAGGVQAAPAAIAASSLLGVRNGLYALELTQLLGVRRLRRAAAAHLTIDESTAVAVSQSDLRSARLGFWLTGGTVFALWNLTTLAGALLGNALGDPRTYGLDAAACAAFTALLWPRLRSRDAVAIAVVAAVVAVVLSPGLPAGVPVLVAALASLIAWRTPRPRADADAAYSPAADGPEPASPESTTPAAGREVRVPDDGETR